MHDVILSGPKLIKRNKGSKITFLISKYKGLIDIICIYTLQIIFGILPHAQFMFSVIFVRLSTVIFLL